MQKKSIEMYDSKIVSTSYNNYLEKITSHVDRDGNISGLKDKCDEFNAAVKANNMNNEMKKRRFRLLMLEGLAHNQPL